LALWGLPVKTGSKSKDFAMVHTLRASVGRYVGLFSLAAFLLAMPFPAMAQAPAKAGADAELYKLVPASASLFIEHRGYNAIKDVFDGSNLGEMAADDAIKSFVEDSRVKIGQMLAKNILDLTAQEDIEKYAQTIHSLCKPFWYEPAAVFLTFHDGLSSAPDFCFICVPGKYKDEAKPALEALMKVGVPAGNKEGNRQAFTYKGGKLTWQGVAKGGAAFKLGEDASKLPEELNGKTLFMACWNGDQLYITASLSAADSLGATLAGGPSKASSQSVKTVLAKTAMSGWSFRWHVDAEELIKDAKAKAGDLGAMMGAENIRGAGGTGGYMDKVYTRLTYIDAPKGVGAFIKKGGSYKTALDMMPSESTFMLAGQFDGKELAEKVRQMVEMAPANPGRHGMQVESVESVTVPTDGDETGVKRSTVTPVAKVTSAATKPDASTKPATGATSKPALSEEQEKVLKMLDDLVATSNGNGGFFVTDLQSIATGMFGGAGMPVGLVLDIKDADKANKIVEDAAKAFPPAKLGYGGGSDREKAAVSSTDYRKITIHMISYFQVALLKDRVVIGMSDNAVKAAIDTALDKTGGFAPDSKGKKLADLCGEGSVIFQMDLATMAKLLWPFMMQATQAMGDSFPFTSLPSTEKMQRLLGPEIAVFSVDDGGILIRSRGKIPFVTKLIPTYPAMGLIWMFGRGGMF
jgi:hypothetical protein